MTNGSGTNRVVLHVAPHPDDETIGCGATLAALRDAGWGVVNLSASLGRPADHHRRRAEVTEATRRLQFTNRVLDPPAPISASDDLDRTVVTLGRAIAELVEQLGADIVVSPHPHDGHHGHETVGRATAAAVAQLATPPVWWMWGLWADLPMPTLYSPFGAQRLAEVLHAVGAYTGENERNPYDELIPARASANMVLGSERVFGYGSARADTAEYADLLTEVTYDRGVWRLGNPRVLDPASPFAVPGTHDVGWWLQAESVTTSRRLLAAT